MRDLSATVTQKTESILVGVMFLLMAVVCGVIACFDGEIIGGVVAACCVLCSGYFFFRSGNRQTLNAEGIFIKNYLPTED